jgi:hypothetical protein
VSGGVRLQAGVFLAERARLWVEAPAARRLAGLIHRDHSAADSAGRRCDATPSPPQQVRRSPVDADMVYLDASLREEFVDVAVGQPRA